MKEKVCSKCREAKSLSEYYKDKSRNDGLALYCKACRKQVSREWFDRSSQPDYKPTKRMREGNVSPFKAGTLQNDIFIHFWRFGHHLNEEQVEGIIRRLKEATSYWKELDAIEAELGCEDYDVNFLELLRQEREHINKYRDRWTGNPQQGVRMLSMEGEYIRTFDAISDASEFICGSRTRMAGAIGNAAAGTCLSSGGYVWEFTDC